MSHSNKTFDYKTFYSIVKYDPTTILNDNNIRISPTNSKFNTNFKEDNNIKTDVRNGIIVHAEGYGIHCVNTHRICAERRLLNFLEYEAKVNGCKGTKIKQWIKKNTGGYIKIWRYTDNGELANAFPCSICRKSIINYNLKVICSIGPDSWFEGYLDDDNKCLSKLTTGQRRMLLGCHRFPLNMHF